MLKTKMPFLDQLQFLSQKLGSLCDKADEKTQKLTDDQLQAAEQHCSSLAQRVAQLVEAIEEVKAVQKLQDEKLRSQVHSSIEDLCASGELNNPATFRRNISIIFTGPSNSNFDSQQTKSRKAVTSTRSRMIQNAGVGPTVLWAAIFPPVAWAGGAMSKRTFSYLIKTIPRSVQWPPIILNTLQKMSTETPLDKSDNFIKFVEEFEKCMPSDGGTDLNSNHDVLSGLRPNSLVALNFGALLDFLGQHLAHETQLQLECPLNGIPLPFIEIMVDPLAGIDARFEFSLRFCELLIQFVIQNPTR